MALILAMIYVLYDPINTCHKIKINKWHCTKLKIFSTVKRASQIALVVKNLLANEGGIRCVGSIPVWGRSLEEGMATHSSILFLRIPWTEEPGGLQSIRSQRVGHD